MSLTISDKGLDLIKQFEGYRANAYRDSVGVATIGWGTTRVNGKAVTMGMTCTQSQATEWLKADCAKFVTKVNKYDSKYNWNQNELDALVSFAYNIGSIDQLTANGTRSKAVIANKILQYNKAGGKVLAGLTSRRKKERELFLTPVKEIESATTNTSNSLSSEGYVVGKVYTLQSNMNVRRTASGIGAKVKFSELTTNAKENAINQGGYAVLKKGTRVTCKGILNNNGTLWMKIPSGYICAYNGKQRYIK